jgi:hypothetical protein
MAVFGRTLGELAVKEWRIGGGIGKVFRCGDECYSYEDGGLFAEDAD